MKLICSLLTVFAGLTLSGPLFAEGPASSADVLQPFVDKHELAGAVALVADKDKVLSVEAVGFADVAAGRAMKTDAMFWIASQSKPITAVAVMMLVDEGKISLDDPVEKYLPEFRGQMVVAEKDNDHVLLRKPAHPFTVREALNHMSGLPFKSAAEEPTLDGLPLAAAVRTYAMTPLATEPGTHYQYSNAGINAAARIIEVVTGTAYEEFMQRRLFEPLGMKDTTFWPNEEQAQRVAKSYRPDDAKTNLVEFPIAQLIYPLSDRARRFPMPAGGLFSTAEDTALFCRMLLNRGELNGRRYLSEAALAELTRRQTPTSVPDSYGLGFSVGSDSFGHGGAHATGMQIHPAQGLVTVWMVQHGGYPGDGAKAQGAFHNWALERFGNRLEWTTGKPSPFARVESPTAAVNGKLYLFGGFNSELGASPQVDVYDPASDVWTRLKDMPTEVTHLNPAVDGNTIWFAGGFKGKHPGPVTEEVWKYDVTADAWSAGPPLPEGRGAGGLAIA